jgi:hypothetical protein
MAARQYSELVIHQTEELVDSSVVTVSPTREGTIDVAVVAHPTCSEPIIAGSPLGIEFIIGSAHRSTNASPPTAQPSRLMIPLFSGNPH